MLRLKTFGGLALLSDGVERPQPRRRLALLGRLASCGDGGVSRDELLAELWGERDAMAARHSLDQLLYEMRRAQGAWPVVGTDRLRVDGDVLTSDVADFRRAMAAADHAAAVAVYAGPFLHGFFLPDALGFEHWVESMRQRYTAEHRRALESLAKRADSDGRYDDAVQWWRRLAADDRLDSRAALGLMRALANAGDSTAALEHARVHRRIVRAELDVDVDPAVSAFASVLRTGAGTSDVRGAHGRDVSPGRPGPALQPPSPEVDRTAPPLVATPSSPFVGRTAALSVAVALLLLALLGVLGRRRGGPAATIPHVLTTNVAANDLYVRGRDRALMRTDSGLQAGIEDFTRAVALDTGFAAAYAGMAELYATATYSSALQPVDRRVMYARASVAARNALALDASLALGHEALGIVRLVGYDFRGAAVELERARALDSAEGDADTYLAKVYQWTGRPDSGLAVARRAQLAQPLAPGANAELGRALYFARRYDDALTRLHSVATLTPPLRRMPEYLAEVYLTRHQWADAIGVLQPLASQDPHAAGLLGYALARSGARADAEQILAALSQSQSTGRGNAFAVAEVYTGLGDYGHAFEWLDRSIDDYSLLPAIMGPLFDSLRADPRFEPVRRRLAVE